jgi:abortive infection bacteriophage resistance protein
MTQFSKPSNSLDEQLAKLIGRGLIVADEDRARHYLANISYYRLSAYNRPLYVPNVADHRFIPNTSFDDILTLYVFDRELRLLLLDAIERLEISLRTQLVNTLADHHGPHGYLDPTIFDTRYNHAWLMDTLDKKASSRDSEAFMQHYRTKYSTSPKQPPIWMAVELLTFKEVSTLFSQLRHQQDTQRIEIHFGWKFQVLKSWFRSLSDLRNLCAHHARVWNREFGSRPEIPKKAPLGWPTPPTTIVTKTHHHPNKNITPQRRLYMHFLVIESLMRTVCPESQWSERMIRLLDQYYMVSHLHMGFPPSWESLPFWLPVVTMAREKTVYP